MTSHSGNGSGCLLFGPIVLPQVRVVQAGQGHHCFGVVAYAHRVHVGLVAVVERDDLELLVRPITAGPGTLCPSRALAALRLAILGLGCTPLLLLQVRDHRNHYAIGPGKESLIGAVPGRPVRTVSTLVNRHLRTATFALHQVLRRAGTDRHLRRSGQ